MKKTVVEDCLVLEANKLNKNNVFSKSLAFTGSVEWQNGSNIGMSSTGQRIAGYDLVVKLDYRWKEEVVNYEVPIVSTPCLFGGRRFWFICPGQKSGRSMCGRRVGKLYKPYHVRYFLCRHCHDLSYRSRQKWKSQSEIGLLLQLIEFQSEAEKLKPGEQPSRRLDNKAQKLIAMARTKGII